MLLKIDWEVKLFQEIVQASVRTVTKKTLLNHNSLSILNLTVGIASFTGRSE